MKKIAIATWAEYMKIRRSMILYVTFGLFTFIPLMMGLLMFVSRHPEIAAKMGIIATKANMFGQNDWAGYFSLLCQSIASVGLLGFGFVTSWVFGREHTERTLKDILALPVGRTSIVVAKFIIVSAWCLLLAAVLYLIGFILGKAMAIPGWSAELFGCFSKAFFGSVVLTLLLNAPIAWLAGISRGIIAPIGFALVTMIMAQFTGLLGLGPYFPWAIPGLFAVGNEAQGMHPVMASYVIIALVFLAGYWATVRWWRRADHH